MRFVDLIVKKRDGRPLSRDEVEFAVRGCVGGAVPDYQASALLMAITLRGMTDQETAWLTDAMVRSGERVDLSDVARGTVGKHSTGGVGDKVSIALAPLVAACGVVVPKMSGRGLGHTGGTLDKLESIPGLRTDLDVEAFKRVLRQVGTCIVGQSTALVPADRKLYALRDVTGSIESIPLIASSIMSKKLAEGSDAIVIDVKCGSGAFMKDESSARQLAASLVDIGSRAGLRTEAVITDMDTPLGTHIGNALEVIECLETLKQKGSPDLRALVVRLGSRMLVLGGVESAMDRGASRVEAALSSGRALETLTQMIEAQGGDPRIVEDYSRLPAAPARTRVSAPRSGYLTRLGAEALGRASHALGAGRVRAGDPVDHAVGVVMLVQLGSRVRQGDPVLELHHRDGRGLEEALSLCRRAVDVGEDPPVVRERVLAEVR